MTLKMTDEEKDNIADMLVLEEKITHIVPVDEQLTMQKLNIRKLSWKLLEYEKRIEQLENKVSQLLPNYS